MERVVVIGSSSSGKTTTGRRLGEILGFPRLELDSVYHQPGWTPVDDVEFTRIVGEFASQDRWVVDGNYTSHGTREAVWPHADTIVWLDLPRSVIMRRVVQRTIRRAITREVLWNGNREPWTNLYSLDPEKNIIVWSWTHFDHVRAKYETCMTDGTWSHAEVHRLRTRSEVENFLASVAKAKTSGHR